MWPDGGKLSQVSALRALLLFFVDKREELLQLILRVENLGADALSCRANLYETFIPQRLVWVVILPRLNLL